MPRYITGLDIGTHTIKAAVGELHRDGQLSLARLVKLPSHGLRKGIVIDVVEATREVSAALGEIRAVARDAAQNIFLGVGSPELRVQQSVGVVAVSRADYEIYRDDVERAIQSSQAMSMPPNRAVVHALVSDFVVDGARNIRDPLGMVGNRLEVSSMIIDDFAPSLKNLTKCVEILGGGLGGLILGPIAGARAMLSKRQKELGVVYADIGFGKTGMAVYEEGKLLHAAVFPVGSGNITNDLAIGLKIPIEAAETIKLSFGTALAKEIGNREAVELPKIDPRLRGTASRRLIADIIEVRLAEIFEFIAKELAYIGKANRLPAGAVLAGGGAKLPGIADLAREELRLSAQVGVADASELTVPASEWSAQAEDPEFASAIGLLYTGRDRLLEGRRERVPLRGILRRMLGYFVP